MTAFQHFVSISGGKDSTATACLAIERAERKGYVPRFLFADTGNEHPLTIEYVAYLGDALGVSIETVRADFSRRFEARRANMRRDWVNELRRKQHSAACRDWQKQSLSNAEKALFREECDCPIKVTPPLPPELVERAVALMVPTGNPFLDMAMLHGRFPGSKTRFCTDELKLEPMEFVKDLVRTAGTPVVEWIGERAEESADRAKKPMIERLYCNFRAPAVLYRPIHKLAAAETFAIAKRHGLKPNPLYLMGMGRVGCMPCIMCGKDELLEISRRFPEQVERIREWERIVGGVARFAYTDHLRGLDDPFLCSFLPSDKLPPGRLGRRRASIDQAVEWSRTGRGGRNFDLLKHLDGLDSDEAPARCKSSYGLCE